MDREQKHEELCNYLHELYVKKNKAYGNSFSETYEKLGIISAITRISDKYNRIVNLSVNQNIDNLGESIRDTLIDMANYAIMTVIEFDRNT